MLKNKIIFLIIIFLSTSLVMAYSPKEGNVTATLGPYFYRTNYSPDASKSKNPMKVDVGVIANGDINNRGALEVAIFHMDKLFFVQKGPYLIAEEAQLIHITMGYRYWLSSYFSAALGFYSSYTLGTRVTKYNDFPQDQIPDTSAKDVTEYGMDFSLMSEVWAQKKWAVILEGRYSLSLTSKNKEKADHYGALLALRYLIQEKNQKPSAIGANKN